MLSTLRCVDMHKKTLYAIKNYFCSHGCEVKIGYPITVGWWGRISDINNSWHGWLYLPEWLSYALPELSGTALNKELAEYLIGWLNNERCPVRVTLPGLNTENVIFHSPERKKFPETENYLKVEGQSASVWIDIIELNFIKFNEDEFIDFQPINVRISFNYGACQISLSELKEIHTGDILLLNNFTKNIIYKERVMSSYEVNEDFSAVQLTTPDSNTGGDFNHIKEIMNKPISSTEKEQNYDNSKLIKDISQLPVTLTFQLCSMEVDLKKISQYRFNDIISLPENVIENIEIYVNGALVGKGELVMISNQLGIEVKKWFAGEKNGF
ncbi:FliM/FliN family flagellar motor switch protein [Escherichia marmotae]|nr:FliM/FliN family flagellar motor switch protein [Escherichia marmotae]MED9360024.1 FliM/FliN family flagellar motor switch protein [Escherichia marmotae]